jgi:hypothetical protein
MVLDNGRRTAIQTEIEIYPQPHFTNAVAYIYIALKMIVNYMAIAY